MMAALIGAAALLAPPQGPIQVAFVLTEGATMIDFAGPWEVFQDVHVEGRGSAPDDHAPFRLYTVSDSRAPIRTSGGMQVIAVLRPRSRCPDRRVHGIREQGRAPHPHAS